MKDKLERDNQTPMPVWQQREQVWRVGGCVRGRRERGKGARGFEGGQMPLKQRVPKLKGFNNPFRIEYQGVNLDTIHELEDALVNPEVLTAAGVLHKNVFVKVLGRGQITRKVDVHVHGASKAAQAAIEAAGGSVTIIPLPYKVRPAANGNQFTNR